MLLCQGNPQDPLPPITLGSVVISWITKSRLLRKTVDDKPTWLPHLLELKKIFANKLNFLHKSNYFWLAFASISTVKWFCPHCCMVSSCGDASVAVKYFSLYQGSTAKQLDLFLSFPVIWSSSSTKTRKMVEPVFLLQSAVFLGIHKTYQKTTDYNWSHHIQTDCVIYVTSARFIHYPSCALTVLHERLPSTQRCTTLELLDKQTLWISQLHLLWEPSAETEIVR